MAIEIRKPLFFGKGLRCFGVADFRLNGEGMLEVICSYKNKQGDKLYPYVYRMPKFKARQYMNRIKCGAYSGRAIPIIDFEVVMPIAQEAAV